MVEELIKKLLESGVHFGHQTKRWNPKMKRFIFGQRSGIYIIDLEKTVDELNKAKEFIHELGTQGGRVLFIGTKKQAQTIVCDSANKSEMYYVNNRWMGGLLTNFQTIRKSVSRLEAIEEMSNNGVWENLKKKELARLTKEKEKLLKDLSGIRDMKGLPQAVFIVDPKREEIAVKEARKLKIPIIAIVDTNCDPEVINFPIPGNDDALKSISFLVNYVTEGLLEGRKEFKTSSTLKVAKEENKGKEEVSAAAQTSEQQSSDNGQDTTSAASVTKE